MPTHNQRMLALIRMVHTVIFLILAGAVFYLLFCGIVGIRGGGVSICMVLVFAEAVVFLGNGRKCPLTALAQKYGAEKGYVFDTFIPESLTRYTFPFFTTVLMISLVLIAARAML
jgi:hypothetical protein